MRGKTMKDKSKKSTYSTTFGVDPIIAVKNGRAAEDRTRDLLHPMQARSQTALRPEN